MLDIGILILRISVGIVMVAHGLPKIFWKREFFNKKWKKEYGFPLGSVILTGILQVVGGLGIIMGVFTQVFSLLIALNMLVATYISIWNHGEPFLSTPEGKGWDVNFLLLGALTTLVIIGGGAWALTGW
jgi:putative oxidoreductase